MDANNSNQQQQIRTIALSLMNCMHSAISVSVPQCPPIIDIVTLDATNTSKKFSQHFIVHLCDKDRTEYFFPNIQCVKKIATEIIDKIHNHNIPHFYQDKGEPPYTRLINGIEKKIIIDPVVYGNNRVFRFWGSTKKSDRPARYLRSNFLDDDFTVESNFRKTLVQPLKYNKTCKLLPITAVEPMRKGISSKQSSPSVRNNDTCQYPFITEFITDLKFKNSDKIAGVIQYTKNDHNRNCLYFQILGHETICPGKKSTHTNNHMRITVHLDTCTIYLTCMRGCGQKAWLLDTFDPKLLLKQTTNI